MGSKYESARAKAGATLLDLIRPGWAVEIDTAKLDLSDCHVCVLGQLFGKYGKGAERIFAIAAVGPFKEGEGWLDSGIEGACERSGFVGMGNSNSDDRNREYRKLTEAWKREIAKRLPKPVRTEPKGPVLYTSAGEGRIRARRGIYCGMCKHMECDYPTDNENRPLFVDER